MLSKHADLYVFVEFMPQTDETINDLIGRITFNTMSFVDNHASMTVEPVERFRLNVYDRLKAGRRVTDWQDGEPPSAKAGRSLELLREGVKRLTRPDMPTDEGRAVYLNEAGEVEESALFDFYAFHLESLIHDSPDMWRPDFAPIVEAAAYRGTISAAPAAPVVVDPSRWQRPAPRGGRF